MRVCLLIDIASDNPVKHVCNLDEVVPIGWRVFYGHDRSNLRLRAQHVAVVQSRFKFIKSERRVSLVPVDVQSILRAKFLNEAIENEGVYERVKPSLAITVVVVRKRNMSLVNDK